MYKIKLLHCSQNRWNEFQLTLEWFQDGEVTTDEFIKAIRTTALGKGYDGLPACLKTFIGAMFKTIDIDGMVLFYIKQRWCRAILCNKQPYF